MTEYNRKHSALYSALASRPRSQAPPSLSSLAHCAVLYFVLRKAARGPGRPRGWRCEICFRHALADCCAIRVYVVSLLHNRLIAWYTVPSLIGSYCQGDILHMCIAFIPRPLHACSIQIRLGICILHLKRSNIGSGNEATLQVHLFS